MKTNCVRCGKETELGLVRHFSGWCEKCEKEYFKGDEEEKPR